MLAVAPHDQSAVTVAPAIIVLEDNEDEEMVDVAVELEDVGNAEAVEIVVRTPKQDDCTLPMEVDDYRPWG